MPEKDTPTDDQNLNKSEAEQQEAETSEDAEQAETEK